VSELFDTPLLVRDRRRYFASSGRGQVSDASAPSTVTGTNARRNRRPEALPIVIGNRIEHLHFVSVSKFALYSAALTRGLPSRKAMMLSTAASFVAITASGV